MTLTQFINKYTGKYFEFPGTGSALYQCLDIMRQHIKEVWGLDPYVIPRAGTAKQAYYSSYSNNRIEKIDNTPNGIPQAGDLIFFKTSLLHPWLYGRAGHVAIVEKADLYNIFVFHQNYPTGSPCKRYRLSYKDCLGWITKR
jgi:hypothetical protein